MMTIDEILGRIKSGESTARAEVEAAIKRAEADKTHALLEIIRDRALERADEIDARIAKGEDVGKLAGVPFVAKDNFLTLDSKTTAAAKILEKFEAPLQATAVERLEAEGAICLGKYNLDALARGGSTESSTCGVTKNAVDDGRVAGGCSGGSAVAIAKGIVPFALGSDTGGSIRQPSSFNGVVGYKPTYGMISRYGVVAMASSTDVVGPITNSVEDVELLCEIMAGQDGRDGTVLPNYFADKIIDKKNDETVASYEKYADDYNSRDKDEYVLSKEWQNLQKWLTDSLADTSKDASIFEIGSGTGRDAEFLQKLGYKNIQTSDVTDKFIEILKEKKLKPVKFNILTDKFYEKYDNIVATAVLLHFEKNNIPRIFSKIYDALNDEGKFLVCVQVGDGSKWKDNLANGKRYFEFYDEKDFSKILEDAGFGELEISYGGGNDDKKWLQVVAKKVEKSGPKKLKIGLINEFMGEGVDDSVRARINELVTKITEAGHAVSEVSLPMVKYALPIYYIVVPAEVSSNLARYDGIRYGERANAKTLAEVYGKSRDQGFVDENKRRIMIGSYVLSSGFFDAYYLQAQKARTLLINEFNKFFEQYDFLIGPVAPTPAFKIGENIDDPIKMYLSDIMTVPPSLAGLPAISIPAGTNTDGLPIGAQIIGPMTSDAKLLNFAKEVEKR